MDTSALQEAFRRRAGQVPSSAGIPGGAPVANAVTPQNPLAASAMSRMPATGAGLPQTMSQGGVQQLGKSMPGEADIILKALIKRLNQNPPAGGIA